MLTFMGQGRHILRSISDPVYPRGYRGRKRSRNTWKTYLGFRYSWRKMEVATQDIKWSVEYDTLGVPTHTSSQYNIHNNKKKTNNRNESTSPSCDGLIADVTEFTLTVATSINNSVMPSQHLHSATNQFTRPHHSQQVIQVYNTGVHSLSQSFTTGSTGVQHRCSLNQSINHNR